MTFQKISKMKKGTKQKSMLCIKKNSMPLVKAKECMHIKPPLFLFSKSHQTKTLQLQSSVYLHNGSKGFETG